VGLLLPICYLGMKKRPAQVSLGRAPRFNDTACSRSGRGTSGGRPREPARLPASTGLPAVHHSVALASTGSAFAHSGAGQKSRTWSSRGFAMAQSFM